MRKLLLSTAFVMACFALVPAHAETSAAMASMANVRLHVAFLAKVSGLAADHSDNAALKAFADREAAAARSIMSAIDERMAPEVAQASVVPPEPIKVAASEMMTGRSAAIDELLPAKAFAEPEGTGALVPAAMIVVDHLSAERGEAFDALFKVTQVNTLRQLTVFYNAYSVTSDDAAFRQIAEEQLASIDGYIAELSRI